MYIVIKYRKITTYHNIPTWFGWCVGSLRRGPINGSSLLSSTGVFLDMFSRVPSTQPASGCTFLMFVGSLPLTCQLIIYNLWTTIYCLKVPIRTRISRKLSHFSTSSVMFLFNLHLDLLDYRSRVCEPTKGFPPSLNKSQKLVPKRNL